MNIFCKYPDCKYLRLSNYQFCFGGRKVAIDNISTKVFCSNNILFRKIELWILYYFHILQNIFQPLKHMKSILYSWITQRRALGWICPMGYHLLIPALGPCACTLTSGICMDKGEEPCNTLKFSLTTVIFKTHFLWMAIFFSFKRWPPHLET